MEKNFFRTVTLLSLTDRLLPIDKPFFKMRFRIYAFKKHYMSSCLPPSVRKLLFTNSRTDLNQIWRPKE